MLRWKQLSWSATGTIPASLQLSINTHQLAWTLDGGACLCWGQSHEEQPEEVGSQRKGPEAGEVPQQSPPVRSTCSLLGVCSESNVSSSCFNNVLNLPALLFRAPTCRFKSLDIHKQLFSNDARSKASSPTASKNPAQPCSAVDLFKT